MIMPMIPPPDRYDQLPLPPTAPQVSKWRLFICRIMKWTGILIFGLGELVGGTNENRTDFVDRLSSNDQIRKNWNPTRPTRSTPEKP